jgi:hypothetical protein
MFPLLICKENSQYDTLGILPWNIYVPLHAFQLFMNQKQGNQNGVPPEGFTDFLK